MKSEPCVEASGKRIFAREKRDRESRSVCIQDWEKGAVLERRIQQLFRKAAEETPIECQGV